MIVKIPLPSNEHIAGLDSFPAGLAIWADLGHLPNAVGYTN